MIRMILKEIFGWIIVIVIAFSCAKIVTTYLFEMTVVSGISMENTLHHKDRLIIQKLEGYITRGAIIVFKPEGMNKNFIKRVVAKPGDIVNIEKDGYVYVNGTKADASFVNGMTYRLLNSIEYPCEVKEGQYFVLGDNREHSQDSRDSSVGLVDEEDIIGVAIMRVYPFDKFEIFE